MDIQSSTIDELELSQAPSATPSDALQAGAPGAHWDSALRCLAWLARHHGLPVSIEALRRSHSAGAHDDAAVVAVAGAIGAVAHQVEADWALITALQPACPLMARLKSGGWVLVTAVQPASAGSPMLSGTLTLQHLGAGEGERVQRVSQAEWAAMHSGSIVLVAPPAGGDAATGRQFGLSWFLPQIAKQKDLLRSVVVAVLALHLLGLAVPVFIQLVIDKVVVHQGSSTLIVLAVGVGIALLFDAVFSYLRQYFLLWATNKIDLDLARLSFSKLLSLPISFFEQRTAGVITRNLQQVDKVRQFLTGRLLSTLLDSSVLLVFLPVLLFYSVSLTLVVLGFASLMGLTLVVLMPAYSTRLKALYEAEGQRQAMLVESVQGMRTIKSLVVESAREREWSERTARAVQLHLEVGRISVPANVLMSLLEKTLTVSVIGIGAVLVFEQQLTVGALIAFQILSGRVSSPIVQLVTLIHEYQETSLSVRMIGEIMNHPSERGASAGRLTPQLQGRVEFDAVSFRYGPDMRPALDRISLNLPAGKVLGVVGKSGSGKTTFTRLLLGMYPVTEGVIRLDGVDLREVDLQHLRSQIGVVLQESFLFRGTVRDNIGIGKPMCSFEEIIAAAQVSGAAEFIERLPRGYDTLIEENGANLSGGQRQRLAIARALLAQPRILILDEAASALDPESEAIFLDNLSRIAAGRTVIMVSHRLATLTEADAIMVLHHGKIADAGRHDELLQRSAIYRTLWQQQTRRKA